MFRFCVLSSLARWKQPRYGVTREGREGAREETRQQRRTSIDCDCTYLSRSWTVLVLISVAI